MARVQRKRTAAMPWHNPELRLVSSSLRLLMDWHTGSRHSSGPQLKGVTERTDMLWAAHLQLDELERVCIPARTNGSGWAEGRRHYGCSVAVLRTAPNSGSHTMAGRIGLTKRHTSLSLALGVGRCAEQRSSRQRAQQARHGPSVGHVHHGAADCTGARLHGCCFNCCCCCRCRRCCCRCCLCLCCHCWRCRFGAAKLHIAQEALVSPQQLAGQQAFVPQHDQFCWRQGRRLLDVGSRRRASSAGRRRSCRCRACSTAGRRSVSSAPILLCSIYTCTDLSWPAQAMRGGRRPERPPTAFKP